MNSLLVRLLARVADTLDGARAIREIERARRAGHRLPPDFSLGPRARLDLVPGSLLIAGDGVRVLHDTLLITETGDTMSIGPRVFISQHCTISGSVSIGADTLIAGFVTILDANHVFDTLAVPIADQGGRKAAVSIGTDVWIGASSIILPGVRIGDHSVIGANSTVTSDIPDCSIAVGSPARVIAARSL